MNKNINNFNKFSNKFIKLDNNINIFLGNDKQRPTILIKNLGSILDELFDIYGITHFFEHLVFQNSYELNTLNACTSIMHMEFYSYYKNLDEINKLISLFYDDNNKEKLLNNSYYNIDILNSIKKELENEFYYRSSNKLAFEPIFALYNRPLYIGGRIIDFDDNQKIINTIKNIWNYISPEDIFILIPETYKDNCIKRLNLTFGKKQKLFNLKLKNIKITLPPVNKIDNPVIYISTITAEYSLSFIFNSNEFKEVKIANLILEYFTNFKLLLKLIYIGNKLIVKYICHNDETLFKMILYTIKNLDSTNFDTFTKDYFNIFIPIFKYSSSPYYLNSIILNKDDLSNLLSLSYTELLKKLFLYFQNLKRKINNYGEFIISTPSNYINNLQDKYNQSYTLCSTKLTNIYSHNNYSNNFFNFFNNDDYYINKTVNLNKLENLICKYYPNGNKITKYKIIKLNNKKLYSINLLNLINNQNIISLNDDNYFESKNNKLNYNNYNSDIFGLNFIDKALNFYLLDTNNLNFSELLFSLQTKYKFYLQPKPLLFNDKTIYINTPYSFVVFVILLPNDSEVDISYLNYQIKSNGEIYTYSVFHYIINNKKYYYLFYPTLNIDYVKNYVYRYIKSYDDDAKLLTIISNINDKLNFNNLDINSYNIKLIN